MGDAHSAAREAQDPNTPVERLHSLSDRFPMEVAANPIWPLLALEDPGAFRGFPTSTLLALARGPRPELVLRVVAELEHEELELALIRNPRARNAPSEAVVLREALPPDDPELLRLAQHPSDTCRLRLWR